MMTDKIEIFHNPSCSKSRATLQLLQDHGFEPVIVEYLKEKLSEEQLGKLVDGLARPSNLLRKKEPGYQERGLSEASTRADVIAAVADCIGNRNGAGSSRAAGSASRRARGDWSAA